MRSDRRGNALEADSPISVRLEAVAARLERVTAQLEQKLVEMRAKRDGEATN